MLLRTPQSSDYPWNYVIVLCALHLEVNIS